MLHRSAKQVIFIMLQYDAIRFGERISAAERIEK